jgi:hypothetical protein
MQHIKGGRRGGTATAAGAAAAWWRTCAALGGGGSVRVGVKGSGDWARAGIGRGGGGLGAGIGVASAEKGARRQAALCARCGRCRPLLCSCAVLKGSLAHKEKETGSPSWRAAVGSLWRLRQRGGASAPGRRSPCDEPTKQPRRRALAGTGRALACCGSLRPGGGGRARQRTRLLSQGTRGLRHHTQKRKVAHSGARLQPCRRGPRMRRGSARSRGARVPRMRRAGRALCVVGWKGCRGRPPRPARNGRAGAASACRAGAMRALVGLRNDRGRRPRSWGAARWDRWATGGERWQKKKGHGGARRAARGGRRAGHTQRGGIGGAHTGQRRGGSEVRDYRGYEADCGPATYVCVMG